MIRSLPKIIYLLSERGYHMYRLEYRQTETNPQELLHCQCQDSSYSFVLHVLSKASIAQNADSPSFVRVCMFACTCACVVKEYMPTCVVDI